MSEYRVVEKGIVRIEIIAVSPNDFVNILWKNDIQMKKIKKENICTYTMDIYERDYDKVKEIANENDIRLHILNRYGLSFLKGKYKNRKAFVMGIIAFIGIIYFLSSFIWSINIETEYNISPYEIRKQLNSLGIEPGVYKKNLDVFEIEDKLVFGNDQIVWAKVRIEGTKLNVKISERQTPPNLVQDDTPCDLVATKDGEIIKVYTKGGTAIVMHGDMVKKDEILVKGIQGKEGEEYLVHAEGEVFAKTYYERKKVIEYNSFERIRTGKKAEKIYFTIMGKKIFLKNGLNNFKIYDKIENKDSFFKKEIYYEVEEKEKKIKDVKKVVEDTIDDLYSEIAMNFDASIRILDKIQDVEMKEDHCKVTVIVIAEENIAVPRINEDIENIEE